MVNGLDSFREKFMGYEDCYTIIGGAACDILLTEADIPFRATKDIDMILLLEDRFQEFAVLFWEYIKEGKYKCGWKSSKDVHFYRFTEPAAGYPVQIELFSRIQDYHLHVEKGIIPIHIDDDISSLSAIILNDDFYDFMMKGRRTVSGVSILDAAYLIPFKMFAWIDLTDRKTAGEHVNERDLKKHKNDVFRLLEIVPEGIQIPVSGLVQEKVLMFLERIKGEPLFLNQIGLSISKEQGIELIKSIFKMNVHGTSQ